MFESVNNIKNSQDEKKLVIATDESGEIENPSIDRHTIIRNRPINTMECGADIVVPTGLSIEIVTDSEKLAEEIQLVSGNQERTQSTIDFVYLTKRNIDSVEESEIPPRPISKGVLGDLVVDRSLSQYGLSGPDKFGSVEGVLFGIYSFERAKRGFLGVHAAQIYDSKKHLNHIVIGNSGMGKSTLAQFLENIEPGRFEVIADDWVEFDPDQKKVRPVSMTFGSTDNTLNNDLLVTNNRINAKFTSFGKNFYTYGGIKNKPENIGAIIQLQDPTFELTTEGMIAYFIKLNRHIPFLTQADKETEFLPEEVNDRLRNILNGYSKLIKHRSFSVLDLNGLDINKKIGQILSILE